MGLDNRGMLRRHPRPRHTHMHIHEAQEPTAARGALRGRCLLLCGAGESQLPRHLWQEQVGH